MKKMILLTTLLLTFMADFAQSVFPPCGDFGRAVNWFVDGRLVVGPEAKPNTGPSACTILAANDTNALAKFASTKKYVDLFPRMTVVQANAIPLVKHGGMVALIDSGGRPCFYDTSSASWKCITFGSSGGGTTYHLYAENYTGGISPQASGSNAVALQYGFAAGNYSFAACSLANAEGTHSVAFGNSTRTKGNFSLIYGDNVFAARPYNLTGGNSTSSTSKAGLTIGEGLVNGYDYATVLGRYNAFTSIDTLNTDSTQYVLQLGTGTSGGARKNAFDVKRNGEFTINGRTIINKPLTINTGLQNVGWVWTCNNPSGGGEWAAVSNANAWTKGGDTITTPALLGTINNKELNIITHDSIRVVISKTGEVAIGGDNTFTSGDALTVNGTSTINGLLKVFNATAGTEILTAEPGRVDFGSGSDPFTTTWRTSNGGYNVTASDPDATGLFVGPMGMAWGTSNTDYCALLPQQMYPGEQAQYTKLPKHGQAGPQVALVSINGIFCQDDTSGNLVVSGLGENIYNSNGVLTSKRTVSGDNYTWSLSFAEINGFAVDANTVTLSGGNGGIILQSFADMQLIVDSSSKMRLYTPNVSKGIATTGQALTLIDASIGAVEFTPILTTAKVVVSSADLLDLGSTHKEILPAPGAGKKIEVIKVTSKYVAGAIPYPATFDQFTLTYGDEFVTGDVSPIFNVYNGGGTNNYPLNNALPNYIWHDYGSNLQGASTDFGGHQIKETENLGIYLSTDGGAAPSVGDGSLNIYITYQIVEL